MPTKKRAPKSASAEPETLTEESVGAKRTMAVQSLDPLVEYLRERDVGHIQVRTAIAAVYGGAVTADRELAVLSLIKGDARFYLKDEDRVNYVGLVAAIAPGPVTADAPPDMPPAKTLGEHVDAALVQSQRIAWPHDVGSSVLFLSVTPGNPPTKAVIRNIHDHETYVLYDLNLGEGTADGVPASRIGRDLDAEGEVAQLRLRIGLLERHHERGLALSTKYVEQRAEETRLSEVLSKHRKKIQETVDELAEHNRKDPNQLELDDILGSSKERGEKMGAEPTDAEDVLAAGEKIDDTYDLEDLDLMLADVESSRFEQGAASTGKPQQIQTCTPTCEEGCFGPHALVDVQDGVAVLLPVLSKDEWKEEMAKVYGTPMALPSDTQSEALANGGRWCGMPVKIRRSTCYLGAESAALLVRLPPKQLGDEPEAAAVGKDAAAGG